MVCETFIQRDSPVRRLDPRSRILAATAFAVFAALTHNVYVLTVFMITAAVCVFAARLPAEPFVRRLAAVNVFMFFVVAALPFTVPGLVLFRTGALTLTVDGAISAGLIVVKANAIVMLFTSLVSTIELVRLGRALHALGMPTKLAMLFFFCIRYLDVVHHEYHRLRQAMKTRCFKPRMNWHSYRSLGYLVGMLLVRSFDRSERVLAAMKCRGFRGEFPVLRPLRLSRIDGCFGTLCALVLCGVCWMEVML